MSEAKNATVSIPASPTGQYPDPVWADVDYSTLVEAAGMAAESETPLSPTGQYPDPVWADVDYSTLVEAAGMAAESETPLGPTGQYPDPVWADVDYSTLVEAAGAATSPAEPPNPTNHVPTAENGASINKLEPATSTDSQTPTQKTNQSAHSAVALDNQEIYRIIRAVGAGISGNSVYEHVDTSTAATDGLRFGIVGFRQSTGELGKLLQIMQRRDPSLLSVIVGSDTAELVQVTTSADRETRLQVVGSQPLWHEKWQEIFKHLGAQPAFQAAQNEAAIELQFRPMLSTARELNLVTDQGLALLYDRVVAMGLDQGSTWIRTHLSPSGLSELERLHLVAMTSDPNAKARMMSVLQSPLLDGTTFSF